MYARYFTFKSKPENRKVIEAMADDIFAYTKNLQGFVSATYVVSEDETEYGSFTVWESKEEAEAAGDSIRERTASTLEEIVNGPPELAVMQVYEPAA
jgi:heme-degrading monooxygenase HmoA